jgi:tyrosinase
MRIDLDIPSADQAGRAFLTWTPVQATARLAEADDANPVKVTLRSRSTGGQVQFATTRTHRGNAVLELRLPANGTKVPFFVAGVFGRPSSELDDAAVQVRVTGSNTVVAERTLMVRVRKDAATLSTRERDRFLGALGTLNNRGAGRFRDFYEMHVSNTLDESHGNVGFLPWHRAYLLDLERELQAIDPAVTLPYWRFDRPAPALFTRAFLGQSDGSGRVTFTPGHALEGWRTAGVLGITRRPEFAIASAPPGLLTEAQTVALGGSRTNAQYGSFVDMEFNPHGGAHTSFSGLIRNPATSPRDPLFFLLHGNVDRLWAKWQWFTKRTDPAVSSAYATPNPNRIGHRIGDTMWPWNGSIAPPRPSTAPGGTLAPSPITTAPGARPTVRAMIDFQAVGGAAPLAFAYDDVPFEI